MDDKPAATEEARLKDGLQDACAVVAGASGKMVATPSTPSKARHRTRRWLAGIAMI
jgi:hypothetical protein